MIQVLCGMGTILYKAQETETRIYFSLIFVGLSHPVSCAPVDSDEGPVTLDRVVTLTVPSSKGFTAWIPTGYH